ncbi:MAG: DNA-packaging protein [Clostridia bacterium]|nr:DNA-packaging protein [Clostridia bacterium]
MTAEQKLTMLRTMMEIEQPDSEEPDEEQIAETAVLEVYLELAKQKILNRMYPFRTDYTDLEVPERYEMTQLNVACYMLNKRGAEGQIQHIENGIHRNYGSADVPNDMLAGVVPYCRVIV